MDAVQARMSQHLSKCHIVVNHMSRLICILSCILKNVINLNVRENHFPKSNLPSVLHLYAYYVSKYLSMPTHISSNWVIEINMCHQYTAYPLHEYVYGPLSEMIEINIFII